MSAIIRGLRSRYSEVESRSRSEDPERTTPPAPTSTLGLRVVNPHQIQAAIDIVFIHGLTGDRESTWTAKGSTACWPELILTEDLPEARIITYGYDADVVNFWSMTSQNTVGDHGQKFLTSLANLRDSTNTSTRPLVFVAHSLGGIVCQDALLKSKSSADQYTRRILEHTRSILFFGTPHCGSGLAEWAVVGSRFLRYFRRVNQQTLEILQQKSEVMARIRQDFHTMLRGWDQSKEREIVIVCFYEELPVRAVGEIVSKASATLDRYISIGIHANHMDMTKFSIDRNPDYQNVLSELRRFIQPRQYQPKKALPLVSSEPSETRNQGCSEQYHTTAHGKASLEEPTKLVNSFSGNFNTGGGKMIQGSEFNSGGGPMSF